MKRLFHITVVAALVALVTGCGGAHRYDARLVAADSLMWTAPDSALATLTAIDSLTGEGNLAYRDLLMTQARYKCYADITASDDSAITRAIDYYRAHSSQREKLTRAYLYKGAVMEELDRVDSAMYYYKTAEVTAAPKDYYNLGYSKMRIAELYESQHSQNDSAIIRLKDAINYFGHLKDTTFLINCYGMIGSISGIKYPDSTQLYLTKAIELAQHFDPPRQYTYKSNLAGLFFYHNKDYPQAKALAMDVLRNGSEDCLEYQFYYYAIFSFLKMGQIDSAKYVLSITPPPIDAVDSMNWFNALAEVAQAEGDNAKYSKNAIKSRELTSQILIDSKEKQLIEAEHIFNNQQTSQKRQSAQRHRLTLAIALAIVIILFTIITWIMRKRLKSMDQERQKTEKELNATIRALSEKLEQTNNLNASTSTLVRYRLEAYQELFDSIRFKAKRDEYSRKHKVITLRNVLSELGDQYALMNVKTSDSFWEKIRLSVDGEFNGIVSYIEKRYPNLSPRDMRIFYLLCANASPQIIKFCMNLTNIKTVSNYRGQFMKKIGLAMSFDEFIKKYLNGELN